VEVDVAVVKGSSAIPVESRADGVALSDRRTTEVLWRGGVSLTKPLDTGADVVLLSAGALMKETGGRILSGVNSPTNDGKGERDRFLLFCRTSRTSLESISPSELSFKAESLLKYSSFSSSIAY